MFYEFISSLCMLYAFYGVCSCSNPISMKYCRETFWDRPYLVNTNKVKRQVVETGAD